MINAPACLLLLLALLLLSAAAGDIRARIIPNRLNAAVAVLAIPFWIACGLSGGEIAIRIVAALAVLVLFAACFAFGLIGGGDVKLLTALALWLPPQRMLGLLVWVALIGGLLSLAMLAGRALHRAPRRPEVPYGVAIAAAGWIGVANHIFTKSGA